MHAVSDRQDSLINLSIRQSKPALAVAHVFQELGIDPSSPDNVPVDLDSIADSLGLKVYLAAFEDPNISGMLILDPARVPAQVEPGGRGTIFLKRGEFSPRSRFTLAHEIGHVVLGHHNGGVITDFYRGRTSGHFDQQEKEANEFAAELLMPRELFTELWASSTSEEELSVVFGVSVTAAAVRAKALGLTSRYEY